SVVVVEKSDRTGGPYRINPASLGMFAVESWMQQELHVDLSREEAFRLLMDHSRWRTDARLVSTLVRHSGPTIAWFNSLGVHFDNVVPYYTGAKPTWHIRHDPENPVIADVLTDRAGELGARFLLNTLATQLIVDDGQVVGVEVRTADGSTRRIGAAATVLAAGGFQGSPELIERYTGFVPGEDLFTFAMFTHPEHQGEGIRMAREAGAGEAPSMLETYIYLPDPYGGPGGTAPDLSAFRQPNLLVNRHGRRFVAEDIVANPADAANAVRRQPGSQAYMILSGSIADHYDRHGLDYQLYRLFHHPGTLPDLAGQVTKAVADGYPHLFRADSVGELAEAIGVPAVELEATVETYNAACREGLDGELFKPARHLRPIEPDTGLFAARFCIGSYGSSGGIPIDEHGRVLDAGQNPVPGLYAGGRDANTLYGGTYPYIMSGAISGFSYTFGRLAGAHAAATARGER
ncbi:FAD-binding protein, partial [Streptomyces sp. NPDC057253]|uniref:FAD-dependent oxidoreductase n=1 Tax=Streptomyces sp. NPDC057253 TaxID=3346069 RepID=UPI003632E500